MSLIHDPKEQAKKDRILAWYIATIVTLSIIASIIFDKA